MSEPSKAYDHHSAAAQRLMNNDSAKLTQPAIYPELALAAAQVHATLALAAAVRELHDTHESDHPPLTDYERAFWGAVLRHLDGQAAEGSHAPN